jgi:hypothetical protein
MVLGGGIETLQRILRRNLRHENEEERTKRRGHVIITRLVLLPLARFCLEDTHRSACFAFLAQGREFHSPQKMTPTLPPEVWERVASNPHMSVDDLEALAMV